MAAMGMRRPTRKGSPNRAVEFKREIAAAACAPGISVAKLALEHGLNANLLFKWRRQYRAGCFGAPDPGHVPATSQPELAPASAVNAVRLLPVQASAIMETDADAIATATYIEVAFRSATVRICGAPEIASLRAVLDTLARRS